MLSLQPNSVVGRRPQKEHTVDAFYKQQDDFMLNLAIKESLKTQCAELHTQYEESGVNWLEMLRGEEKILPKFCLHLLNQYTQDNNVHI